MRIDKIDNKVFDDPVPNSSPSSGLDLNTTDSVESLSSPFRNRYANVGNFASNVSSGSTGSKKGLTAAERNNNPFNIKFGKFAAKYGATKENKAALDGGSFATFPNVEAGFTAAKDLLKGKSYRGLTVDQAMKRWSNSGYGGEIYPEIAVIQVSQLSENQLNELQRRQIVREDRNYAKKLGFLTNLPKYAYGGDLPKLKSTTSSTAVSRPIARPAIDYNNIGQDQFNNPDLYRSLTSDKRPLVSDVELQMKKLSQYNTEQGDYYNSNPDSITIKDSRFNKRNNQKVNKALLTDILNASKKTGVDPYDALSIAQRESGIGHWSSKSFGNITENIHPDLVFSNWHGKNLGLNKEELEGYTDPKTGNRHITPKAYTKAATYVAGATRFPFAGEMQTLKEKGIRGYNPGDPNYAAKVAQERQILMSPENKKFRTYVDSVYNSLPAYKYGGCLPKMAGGGLVSLNPRSYNTNNQLANGLDRYTTQPALNNVIQQNSVAGAGGTQSGGGFNAGLLSTGLGLAGQGVAMFDSNPEKVNQKANIGAGILAGAASGATVGSLIPGWGTAVGAVVGGAIGGISAGIKGNKRKKAIQAGINADQRAFNSMQADRSANAYRQLQPYQYKFGGHTGIQPTYEVEKDEVIQGTPILEHGTELGGGLHLVGGKTHAQGGTLGAGEGRVFSNSISFTGGTPAKQAKRIGNQLKKYEANLSSKDKMKRDTAELMTDKLNIKLNELYEAQEQYKALPQFKYGGNLPKFADGGTVNEKRESIKRRIKTLDNYLKQNSKRQAIGGYDPKDDLRKERNQLQAQLDNPNIWKGEVFNPLDRTKNVAFPDRVKPTSDIAWTNDLKPVNIKGKRNIPTPKPIRRTQPQITRTDISVPGELIPQPMSVDTDLDVINRNGDEIFNRINAEKFQTTPVAPARKKRGMGLKFKEDDVLPLALSTAGYLNSARSINLMDTNVPSNTITSPYYNYADRSRLARHDLQATANTLLRSPNLNPARRQAIFASVGNALNQINNQENVNRFAYDNDYAGKQLQINAQNTAILNNAQQQRIANRNAQQGLRSQNFNSFMGNINTALAERNARDLDERKFKVISDSYRRQYGTNFDVTLQ